MNIKMVASILGKVMLIEAVLMVVSLFVSLGYGEKTYLSFIIPIAGLIAIGVPLSIMKVKDKNIYAKEGFVIVALSWIILSLVGALPFVISREIPNYVDALFETVSGFSTTGASILDNVDALSRGIQFWRVFTHWIGGMGVLVFVLAILPSGGSGSMHIYRAESPGPSASKLVGKMRQTARILYGIYVIMTLLEMIFLMAGGMSIYDSVLNAFSTAGTGGFGIHNGSIAYYNSVYSEMVIAVFMFLFGINFNLFYLILIGNFSRAIRNEEFRVYLFIVVSATIVIALNIMRLYENNFGTALRYSFFQVTAINSTTGFSSCDFDTWPALSKGILLFLTIVGGCAGSTGGGIKVCRVIVLFKSSFADLGKMSKPRSVKNVKLEGNVLSKEVEKNVKTYIILYIFIFLSVTALVGLDSYLGGDIFSAISSTLACIGNVGPGFNLVGPMCSYSGFSAFSKIVLSLTMIAGRLEIFPLLILFLPSTWRR